MATAADALVIVFAALDSDEQREVLERMTELRVRSEAGAMSDTESFISSLRQVADYVGHAPSVGEYKQAREELRAAGADIESFTRLYRHFGSWPRVKEALALSETTTARRIEARFRYRQVGKVWRYSEELLRETLGRCAEHYSRPPLVAEFEWWRDRELELARAEGNAALHLRARARTAGAGVAGRPRSCTSATRRTRWQSGWNSSEAARSRPLHRRAT